MKILIVLMGMSFISLSFASTLEDDADCVISKSEVQCYSQKIQTRNNRDMTCHREQVYCGQSVVYRSKDGGEMKATITGSVFREEEEHCSTRYPGPFTMVELTFIPRETDSSRRYTSLDLAKRSARIEARGRVDGMFRRIPMCY